MFLLPEEARPRAWKESEASKGKFGGQWGVHERAPGAQISDTLTLDFVRDHEGGPRAPQLLWPVFPGITEQPPETWWSVWLSLHLSGHRGHN